MSGTNPAISGYIDFYGFSSIAGGWVLTGWIGRDWDGADQPVTATLEFDAGTVAGSAAICVFERGDIKKVGVGLVALVDSADARLPYMTDAVLAHGERAFRLVAAQTARKLDEQALLEQCRDMIAAAPRTAARADLLRRFSRSRYGGRDTLAELPAPVFLELDALYMCPPHGVLLRGWFADPFGTVARLRLRAGATSQPIDPAQWIRIPRPDVVQSLGERVGSVDRACGFLAYVAPIGASELHFEVETVSGAFAFRPIRTPAKAGIAAIREILGVFDLRHGELTRGFDLVAGPAIASLNQQRLRTPPFVSVTQYGEPPERPRASIVVPLYGRMDFVEYQLGLFHRTLAPDHELIYVLDDPDRQRELEGLAAACHAKFRRAFTVLGLSHNMGYAPANNVGLRHARAEHVCFLNSDVFPRTPDWLEQMLRSAAEPDVGAVGALLLFEDGTVQHQGIAYEKLHEFDDWIFSLHPAKGRHPARLEGTDEVEGVTGACLLMRTDLALALGGFDEGYVVGDFEDVDLCRRIQARGLRCVVNRRAQLYHLERQSQGDQAQIWRTNLTLFNAWRFQRKWAAAPEAT
jgi:GT2 family glycosyltransferase